MNTAIDVEQIAKDLEVDEGFVPQPYQCSAGKTTIGIGWNIEDTPLSKRAALFILQDQLGSTIAECEKLPWFHSLSTVRKGVIINMIFNMGMGRFLGFSKTIAYIKDGDFDSASVEMLDSKWAKHDVGTSRSGRLSKEMREG